MEKKEKPEGKIKEKKQLPILSPDPCVLLCKNGEQLHLQNEKNKKTNEKEENVELEIRKQFLQS